MSAKSSHSKTRQFSEELLKRTGAIKTRSEKIVNFPYKQELYQDVYDRANILLEASKDPKIESRAYTIIQKIQSGEQLTQADMQYEITDLEELNGTLLPTLEWQYGRRQDRSVARRSFESLIDQIDSCIDLLFKQELTLADLPSNFNWCKNNRIELIYNEEGEERFFKRLFEDIQNAKQYINIVMFGMKGKIGNEHDIAWQVAKALADKASDGIEVNLLIDAKGCGLSWPGRRPDCVVLVDWLQQQGVNVVVNHPLKPFDLQRFLRFDHRKIYIIDGKIGYCGGMGIENHFFYNWFDVMLRMEGEIVNQLQMHFLSTFHWQGGKLIKPGQSKHEIRQKYFPRLKHEIGNLKTKLLVSIPAPGRRVISEIYVKALENTKQSFYFMNPYCFTDWLVLKMQLLAEKLYKKGLIWRPRMERPEGVAAMFPSSGYTFPFEEARRNEYENLKNAGIGLMIYPGVLHSKVYVRDVQYCNIGSFNIDDASLERNWETNVLIDDRKFAEHTITELFQNKEANVEIKVTSDINYSVLEKMKHKIADAIDFVT
jgi:cardiolipin synthase